MKPSSPTAVLFDLGNVLVDWHPRHAYLSYFQGDQDRLNYFLNHIWSMDWHHQLDSGQCFSEAIAALSQQYPDWADAIAAYDTLWEQMFKGEITGSVRILEELAATGTPLYALTNFPAEKYPAFVQRYDFMRHFHGQVVVSGEEKLIKPDRQLYQRVLDRFGLEASDVFFIDDRQDNIDAARALGMDAVRFESPAQLRQALIERQLLCVD